MLLWSDYQDLFSVKKPQGVKSQTSHDSSSQGGGANTQVLALCEESQGVGGRPRAPTTVTSREAEGHNGTHVDLSVPCPMIARTLERRGFRIFSCDGSGFIYSKACARDLWVKANEQLGWRP